MKRAWFSIVKEMALAVLGAAALLIYLEWRLLRRRMRNRRKGL